MDLERILGAIRNLLRPSTRQLKKPILLEPVKGISFLEVDGKKLIVRQDGETELSVMGIAAREEELLVIATGMNHHPDPYKKQFAVAYVPGADGATYILENEKECNALETQVKGAHYLLCRALDGEEDIALVRKLQEKPASSLERPDLSGWDIYVEERDPPEKKSEDRLEGIAALSGKIRIAWLPSDGQTYAALCDDEGRSLVPLGKYVLGQKSVINVLKDAANRRAYDRTLYPVPKNGEAGLLEDGRNNRVLVLRNEADCKLAIRVFGSDSVPTYYLIKTLSSEKMNGLEAKLAQEVYGSDRNNAPKNQIEAVEKAMAAGTAITVQPEWQEGLIRAVNCGGNRYLTLTKDGAFEVLGAVEYEANRLSRVDSVALGRMNGTKVVLKDAADGNLFMETGKQEIGRYARDDAFRYCMLYLISDMKEREKGLVGKKIAEMPQFSSYKLKGGNGREEKAEVGQPETTKQMPVRLDTRRIAEVAELLQEETNREAGTGGDGFLSEALQNIEYCVRNIPRDLEALEKHNQFRYRIEDARMLNFNDFGLQGIMDFATYAGYMLESGEVLPSEKTKGYLKEAASILYGQRGHIEQMANNILAARARGPVSIDALAAEIGNVGWGELKYGERDRLEKAILGSLGMAEQEFAWPELDVLARLIGTGIVLRRIAVGEPEQK